MKYDRALYRINSFLISRSKWANDVRGLHYGHYNTRVFWTEFNRCRDTVENMLSCVKPAMIPIFRRSL